MQTDRHYYTHTHAQPQTHCCDCTHLLIMTQTQTKSSTATNAESIAIFAFFFFQLCYAWWLTYLSSLKFYFIVRRIQAEFRLNSICKLSGKFFYCRFFLIRFTRDFAKYEIDSMYCDWSSASAFVDTILHKFLSCASVRLFHCGRRESVESPIKSLTCFP